MSLTHFPHGISSFGDPIYGGAIPHLGPLGKVFVVVNTAAKFAYLDQRYGTDPDLSVPRVYLQNGTNNGIQNAITNCRNKYGDVILIEPGYYLVTTGITLAKDHITIMARNDARIATVLYGGDTSYGDWTSDLLTITGSYYRVEGLGLYTYYNAGSAIVLNDAGDDGGGDDGGFGQIVKCTFPPEGGGVGSEKYGIKIKGANNVTIDQCNFSGQLTAGIRFEGGVGNPINPIISNTIFNGCVAGVEVATSVFGGVMDNCHFTCATYPAAMAMTYGFTGSGGGEFDVRNCTGPFAANALNNASGISILGTSATGQGYIQLSAST